jgi:uncharacterized protein
MRFFQKILMCCVFLIGTSVSAQDFPKPLTPYVSDFANLIDPETEARLTKRLVEMREALDLEMAVVTIETRFDYGEFKSIEEFATGLFNTWGIGDATRNDGALILVSRSDREMRIELGSSYGPIFDDRMALVIQHHFLPYFKGDQLSEGIESGTYEAIKRLQPTYDITDPSTLEKPSLITTLKRTPLWRVIEDKFMLFVFVGIVAFLFFEKRLRDTLVGLKRCPNCNRRQLHRKRTEVKEATAKESGEELMETVCSSCDYHAKEHRIIPFRSSSNETSSGGGFGGGSSSGGGASGRW